MVRLDRIRQAKQAGVGAFQRYGSFPGPLLYRGKTRSSPVPAVSGSAIKAPSTRKQEETMSGEPWYQTTLRWAQTNLVECDPARYDADWWREHWRKTRIQGVIINAGGIVAYYPSRFPLHHRAEKLGDRDLYGEIVAAAREEGLTVLARMDSNRVAQDFYEAHPNWACRDIHGDPYRQADKFVTCIGSPYYTEYLPAVMEEII